MLPPAAEPFGPRRDDAELARAFVQGEPAGFSRCLHAEGPVLLADRDVPLALRIGARNVLVRVDLPQWAEPARSQLERAASDSGLILIEEETLFAVPVALQMVGLRLSSWDLWGSDMEEAYAALREAAAGAALAPVVDCS